MVCLSPMMPPNSALVEAKRKVVFVGREVSSERRDKGAIFCHVDRVKQMGQDDSCMVEGNQKWVGAAPSFVRRARDRRGRFTSLREGKRGE